MASIVLSSVGNSVGNLVLPGVGGRILGAVGRAAGKNIDRKLGLAEELSDGARLDHFTVQDSKYGLPIPFIFGRARVSGNVIWASDMIETAHKEKAGGKGGAGSLLSSSRTSYSYSVHCAIALGEGEIGGIQTVWADGKAIYQNGVWKAGVVGSATFYAGTPDQEVDPLLESWIGDGMVPAYRGVAYVVFESLQLAGFGNRLPNLSFEILPKAATGNPLWLGGHEPDAMVSGYANRNGGALPIVIQAGSTEARIMLFCGYETEGATARFVVCEMDVAGKTPVLIARTCSPYFSVEDIASHSWALAPDRRFVAIGVQDSGAGRPFYVMMYDSVARVFGSVSSFSMELSEYRQMAWIDAQRIVFQETQSDARGLRVLTRAGTEAVDLGYHDVWGAGSRTTRKPLGYAQFVPCADGLLFIAGDAAPIFTTLYARHVAWVGNALVPSETYTLSSGVALGSGSNAQNFIVPTGEEEWTFVHASVIDLSLMSFRCGKTESLVLRAWKKFETLSAGTLTGQAPVVYGKRILVVQKPVYEGFYRVSEIALGEDGFVMETEGEEVGGFEAASADFSACATGANKVIVLGSSLYGFWAHWGVAQRRNTGDTLDNVVGSLLARAGYREGDYDVSALSDVPVDGYVVSSLATALSSLVLLHYFEPFDLIECDGQLKAVRRGIDAGVEIQTEEVGAFNVEKKIAGSFSADFSATRIREMDLPVELTVDTLDASRDYEAGSHRARRTAAKGGARTSKLSLPVVCAPSVAKKIAERTLYGFWAERTGYKLSLSARWATLDPSDIINVDGKKIRVTETSFGEGVVKVEGVCALGDALTSGTEAESGAVGGAAQMAVSATVLFLMDLPLLRSEYDNPGLYAAVTGGEGWTGATLWRTSDGVNFSQVSSFSKAAVAGTAVTVLPARSCLYPDHESAVWVQLYQGELNSCTEAQWLNGANAALVGDEILQFRTATLAGPGLYALSGLLRGRSGTEAACSTHRLGEPFVLLSDDAPRFLPALLSERGQNYFFRAVSNGGSLALAQQVSVGLGMRTLEPLAPAHVRGYREGADVRIVWVRRVRKNGEWVDYIDAPLDEPREAYDVEIMDGASVVRLFENVQGASLLYTAAQQGADWPAGAPENFVVRVYQLSDRYGRGQRSEAVI